LNTNYVYPSAQVGEFRAAMLYGSGPSSYASTGDPVNNPGANEYINFPSECTSVSGNYRVRFQPTAVGLNIIRAGAPAPSQSGWNAIWEYAGGNISLSGVPLTLGPLSSAATNSVFTANGVATVSTTTPPPVNSFVLLTNGASNKGIFLNGVIVQVTAVVPGVSYSFNFAAAKSLNYASASDTLKWQQIFAGTSSNPLALGTGTGQSIAVTAVAVASNVLTITATNTGITVQPGMFIVLQGLAAGEVPQGCIVQVLTASATTLTANLIAPNLGATSNETATATVLVTNGNAPIQANTDSFSISGTTVAATAASATAAGNITALPVNQTLIPGNIVIVQGLTHGSALNGLITPVLSTSLTSTNLTTNGYIASAVVTGTGDSGALGLLQTGNPVSGGQVSPGTNLAGETVQFQALISSL
jgi:hypothetical protein